MPADWTEMLPEAREEWLLGALEDAEQLDAILDALAAVAEEGDLELADAWGGLAADTLAERRDRVGLAALWCRVSGWRANDKAFKAACRASLASVFRARADKERLTAAGFDADDVDGAEALRRLQTLLALDAGVLCLDKTWGFGVVKRVDDFYGKVTIDFEDKPGHEFSFAHAAQVLQLPLQLLVPF